MPRLCIVLFTQFHFSVMKANLQTLLNEQSKKNGIFIQIRSYLGYMTYDRLKFSMKWFLESASISFSITVRFI